MHRFLPLVAVLLLGCSSAAAPDGGPDIVVPGDIIVAADTAAPPEAGPSPDVMDAAEPSSDADAAGPPDTAGPPDAAGPPDDGEAHDAGVDVPAGPEEPYHFIEGPCFDGLPAVPFDDTATEAGYDLPVPDFSVETLDGRFTLSRRWTGCDHFVFVLHHDGISNRSLFWNSPVSYLLGESAPNAQYVFVVLDPSALTRRELVEKLQGRFETALERLTPEEQTAWGGRLHFVLDNGDTIPAVAAALNVSRREAHFTVDRHQLLREGHNAAQPEMLGWVNRLAWVRFWPRYFNYLAVLDARYAAEEAAGEVFVHRAIDGVEIRGSSDPVVWSLPDAPTMARYERLIVDMTVDCPGARHPYRVYCGEWDVTAGIFLCGDEECTPANRRRIIKWITPYSAPGRWQFDITPELVFLTGGDIRIVTAHGDNNVGPYTYKYTVDFRFYEAQDELRPFATETLIPMGTYGWDASYDERFGPFVFTPPEGTRKVELYARISGHGQGGATNCAEFCTFTHEFTFNETPFAYTYEMESDVLRCAELVDQGVVPNQGGTWPIDRSSWCPGWLTEEWREDVTAAVLMGEENTITYRTGYGDMADSTTGGGYMDARVELVYYR